MIRIVLDTNILISALLTPTGLPAQVLLLALLEPDIQICASGATYSEYEEVLRRPKFHRSEDEINTALQTIRKCSMWVRPTDRVPYLL